MNGDRRIMAFYKSYAGLSGTCTLVTKRVDEQTQ